MISDILIVVPAVCLLPVVLYFEKNENRKGLLPAKTVLSLLFICAIAVQPCKIPAFYHFLFAGLVFCLLGDVCLVFSHRKMFLSGLIFFLLGHVLYVCGFFSVTYIRTSTWVGAFAVCVAGASVFRWLKPHLGDMKIPVLIYTVVISAMLTAAWSILFEAGLPLTGRMMVFWGAFCFYISDIFVARDRFLKNEFFNRLLGLPLYYAGQFLLAFSVSFMRNI